MAQGKEEMITIDGIEYKLSDLSDGCRNEIESLAFCETEIMRMKALLAVAGTAKIAYSNAIIEQLPKTKEAKH